MNGPVVFGPLSMIAAATGFLVTGPPPAAGYVLTAGS